MSYLVLARKYRPQTFDDVVKQEHVTQTLSHAIVSGRVAHAILFSGPRGTGKTTVARILAKAMNCKKGPTPTPCNECQSCKEITSGNAADVFEIDGASNNGVDQIRELRENVKYMPAHSPYKIYIIDEVHMLSIAAFNALLKTLEEPPPHVMFLFATTEPHKIPITILSRCQRHDLRRISIVSVSDHIAALCAKEGIDIDRESLELIAGESGGSMRDALSLLDQVMSCAEGKITSEKVLGILGIIDRSILFDISACILRGDVPELLDILDIIYDNGHNIKELYADLLEHFRNLLIVKMGKKIERLVDVPVHELRLMSEQVKDISEMYLSRVLDMLFKEESAIQFSLQPKLALEMAFIRMFQAKPVLPVDILIEKLDNLQKGIYENPDAYEELQNIREINPLKVRDPAASESRISDAGEEQQRLKPESSAVFFDSARSHEENWARLINMISGKKPAMAASLKKCGRLRSLTDQSLEIEVGGNDFELKLIHKNQDIIKECCNVFFGKSLELSFVTTTGEHGADESPQEKKTRADQLKTEALNHPLIKAAVEIFGGKITDVKLLQ